MKRKLELLIAAFAVAMILTVGVNVKAEKVASCTSTSKSVTINFAGSNSKEVKLVTKGGAFVDSVRCTSSAYFYGIKANRLYYMYYRYYAYDYSTGGYVYSKWSKKMPVCVFNVSVKLSGGKVRFKVPKIAGIKKFKLYMSTKSGSGYKKLKTIKPGKTFKVSKFKGKKFKYYKTYYYRVDAFTKAGKKSITSYAYNFYIYRVYR